MQVDYCLSDFHLAFIGKFFLLFNELEASDNVKVQAIMFNDSMKICMEIILVRNDIKDENRDLTDVFSARIDINFLAEKLAQLMPLIISKIVQREFDKTYKNATICMLSGTRE